MSPLDLDTVQARADAADQGKYQAKNVTDIFHDGPWDDEADQPVGLWWVDRPGWIDDGDSEGLFYSEADARYAETMQPRTTLTLIAELRAAREANFDLHQLAIDLDAHDLTAAAAHRLRNILSRWNKVTREVPR